MTIVIKNQKALSKFITDQADRIEKALIYQLEYLVEELENHAKLSAGYLDQTSNLKGAIGGLVLKDGRPITYKGFTGGTTGATIGKEFIDSLISDRSKGFVIIIVAGMEYASYVENFHGLNVLKKTELKLNSELPKIIQKLKRSIK